MSIHTQISSSCDQLEILSSLSEALEGTESLADKIKILDSNPFLKDFFAKEIEIEAWISKFSEKDVYLLKSILAIGQGSVVLDSLNTLKKNEEKVNALLSVLRDVDKSYDTIGGIIGYHLTILKLLSRSNKEPQQRDNDCCYEEPEGVDLSLPESETDQAIRWGIERMDSLAEIYPVGGAGDRLNLKDEVTGEPLPAAQLSFFGYTLLEGLIRDIQGREFLYYQIFDKQILTPLAMMTSHEKKNYQRIKKLCETKKWFGRPRESFSFFIQPLVPVVTCEGFWAMHAPLEPILKPGGHGMIWKTAIDEGVFDWLEKQGRHKAIVRQINNPVAGIDHGLLILSGIGCKNNKKLGFASCFRVVNTAEGMNVLRESKSVIDGETAYEYSITNVEYTDFEKKGIKDTPRDAESSYSRFPSNTNILFIDLKAVKEATMQCPIPGMLINMKTKVTCKIGGGEVTLNAGRLESTMQNIADYIVDTFHHPLQKGKRGNLSSFLTFNKRQKTISVTKQSYVEGKEILGTPEGCFFDLMQNYRDLLSTFCGFEVPEKQTEENYLKEGPSLLIAFHPALGPLYDVICQKIKRGSIGWGSEWVMEIAQADIQDLSLEGSLLVEADSLIGKVHPEKGLIYSKIDSGKCTLLNVRVKNRGLNRETKAPFWKKQYRHHEALRIVLHGNAEFYAKDVSLEGDLLFEVPDGYRLKVYEEGGKIVHLLEKMDATWAWSYFFNGEHKIELTKECFPVI